MSSLILKSMLWLGVGVVGALSIPSQAQAQDHLYGLSSQELMSQVGNAVDPHKKGMTPYEAAQARYERLMAHRPTIKRASIACLPMWCKNFNANSSSAAVKNARRLAERIEDSHKELLKTRLKNQSASEKEQFKQLQQQREDFFKKIQQQGQDFQSTQGSSNSLPSVLQNQGLPTQP